MTEWAGLLSGVLGLVLYLLKRYGTGTHLRSAAEKAREIVDERDKTDVDFQTAIAVGEVGAADRILDDLLGDLDALGMPKDPPKSTD